MREKTRVNFRCGECAPDETTRRGARPTAVCRCGREFFEISRTCRRDFGRARHFVRADPEILPKKLRRREARLRSREIPGRLCQKYGNTRWSFYPTAFGGRARTVRRENPTEKKLRRLPYFDFRYESAVNFQRRKARAARLRARVAGRNKDSKNAP